MLSFVHENSRKETQRKKCEDGDFGYYYGSLVVEQSNSVFKSLLNET